jgi:hypothetical protein
LGDEAVGFGGEARLLARFVMADMRIRMSWIPRSALLLLNDLRPAVISS